jgi:NADPH:quinone reductase-like Zn-dependent oxidoreductase
MEAFHLIKNGSPATAFERRPISLGKPGALEVAIEVEAFGLNFADVTARLGLYRDCPPLPTVIGYEVVGKVMETGAEVDEVKVDDRVIAFTRFGGYATHVITDSRGVAKIEDDYPVGKALALGVQYATAYFSAEMASSLYPGEKVLIQAAAGGVGTALVQLCKLKGCKIYGTAGSEAKLAYLRNLGVDVPINYREQDFSEMISEELDVVYDSIGGNTFKKGFKLLGPGGRMVSFGAASQLDIGNFFSKIRFGLSFGFYHPVQFIANSKSISGVNMLKIADNKPFLLKYAIEQVALLAKEGKIDPHVGGLYPASQLKEAHTALETRKTMGKVGVFWEK